MRTIKTWWVIAAFLSGVAVAMQAEELILRMQDNRVELTAPRVHFITGEPLKRLRNAAAVPFGFQVKLAAGRRERVVRQSTETFVISYDLFEERFKVSRLTGTPKSASHLSSEEAEAWCFHEISGLDLSGIAASEQFWIFVDIRSVDDRDASLFGRDTITDNGISLKGLIERLSGPAKPSEVNLSLEAGPLTLEQLRRGRG